MSEFKRVHHYDNGQLKIHQYLNDKILITETYYKDGSPLAKYSDWGDGSYQKWHNNGKLWFEYEHGFDKYDVIVNTLKVYDETGRLCTLPNTDNLIVWKACVFENK